MSAGDVVHIEDVKAKVTHARRVNQMDDWLERAEWTCQKLRDARDAVNRAMDGGLADLPRSVTDEDRKELIFDKMRAENEHRIAMFEVAAHVRLQRDTGMDAGAIREAIEVLEPMPFYNEIRVTLNEDPATTEAFEALRPNPLADVISDLAKDGYGLQRHPETGHYRVAGLGGTLVDPATDAPVVGVLVDRVQTEIDRADAREIAARIRGARAGAVVEEVAPVAAGSWLFAEYVEQDPIWGRADEVLLADEESLFVVAKAGVGKTTLAGNLVRGFTGLSDNVLGYPVRTFGTILYLAMDRPAQVRRALRRHFTDDEAETLNERLVIRPGPIPGDLGRNPEILLALAREAGADVVIIDSVKDACSKLTDDEAGGNFNRAVQACLAAGVAVVALHHQRKGVDGAKPNKLEDVYGSTWLTAGAGSVILLWGEPGAGVAELIHLKSPSTPVGPITVEINTSTGDMTASHGWDALTYLRRRANGATVADAAQAMKGSAPTIADQHKARRRLDALVARGLATKDEGARGGEGGTRAAVYRAVDELHEVAQ